MDDFEKLKFKRAVIRQLITKLINKIDKSLLETLPDYPDLYDSLNQLIEKNETLKDLDLKIENYFDKSDELESEIIQSQEYQDRVVAYKGKIERYLLKCQTTRQEVTINSGNNNLQENITYGNISHVANVKLPKLEINKFFGDACEWHSFWNSYNIAIHSNESLKKIDKFNYLKMYLGGVALSAISGFSLTESNYDSSIKLLTERFGRQDLIISSHMNKLLSINSVRNSYDIKALRKFYDECEIHIRSLQSMNVTKGSYGNLLCPVILQKLPEDLNLDYNKNRKSSVDFDIDELISFIRKEVECREASHVLSNSSKKQSVHFETQQRSESHSKHNYNRKFSSSSALVSASNNIFCLFCNSKNHESKDCSLTIEEKKQMLKDQFRCFRCLKKYHTSKKCWNKCICTLCKKQHSELICDKSAINNESKEKNDTLASVTASCVSKRKQNEMIYLQTSLAYLIYGNVKKFVRILFDSGSHRSFLKRDICNELNLRTIKTERLHVFGFGEKISKGCSYDLVKVNLQHKNDKKHL
ncbi:uncharacterized protein [Parasteatoda tepidariorum]|uniref:uncharacterized protein n=1 Tax=Parasteatoda tepidariorum TaxID=114398 RepID=UPI0039BC2F85